MQNFEYLKAKSISETSGPVTNTKFLAGGTTLIDLMKLNVEKPARVIDINALPFSEIKENSDGSFFIGALVKNSSLAYDAKIAKKFRVLSQAILAGASAQLRNKASTSGNLLQRTRCVYFRDASKACNKREPGSGCSAINGANRNLAILGTSDACIATNPSDMNVAMMALDAEIVVKNGGQDRMIPIQEFYLLPGQTPHLETVLKAGDFITGVNLKPLPSAAKSSYLKLRDRASYEFALASAAVIAEVKGGNFTYLKIAMGGIGTLPWRCKDAENALLGKPAHAASFAEAARLTLQYAKAQTQNGFKIELAKRCLIHSLQEVCT